MQNESMKSHHINIYYEFVCVDVYRAHHQRQGKGTFRFPDGAVFSGYDVLLICYWNSLFGFFFVFFFVFLLVLLLLLGLFWAGMMCYVIEILFPCLFFVFVVFCFLFFFFVRFFLVIIIVSYDWEYSGEILWYDVFKGYWNSLFSFYCVNSSSFSWYFFFVIVLFFIYLFFGF